MRAYIEYTALHGPDDPYADPLKYLVDLDKQHAPKEFLRHEALKQEESLQPSSDYE